MGTTILGSIILSILLGYFIYQTRNVRKHAYLALLDKKTQVYTACAGSDNKNKIIPATKEIKSLEHNIFKDKEGNIFCPDEYIHFIVQGESMQFCGIHDNDLIFADAQFNIEENIEFPIVLVLRKHNLEERNVQYKIRRTWMRHTYTSEKDLIDIVEDKILQSAAFQEIRQLNDYDGDTALIDDLRNERIKNYEEEYIKCKNPNKKDREIVISTTFHTKEKKIRFSLHPISTIEGKVIASFSI